MRVIAAMSGGVDSAVAAARAVDSGHDVTGIHLALSRTRQGARGCCSAEDARDARRAADVLGIPFYVWDVSAEFSHAVVDDFVAEYSRGRTPNPCLRCNERIKFSAVLDRALALGFDAVCTGHYARIVAGPHGPELHRARDDAKDQSYVLAVLGAEQVAASLFPLGESLKSEVRADAAARGLAVADKPDSHDICFIPDGDTAGFLRERLGDAPGDIIDAESGETLGRHSGAYAFTVGQRRGLGLTVPDEQGQRRYVVAVEADARQVIVGTDSLLGVRTITADSPVWCGTPPGDPAALAVQVRAHGERVGAVVEHDADAITAHLESPLRGVAPGQALVLYDGTRVVGSGTIRATHARAE